MSAAEEYEVELGFVIIDSIVLALDKVVAVQPEIEERGGRPVVAERPDGSFGPKVIGSLVTMTTGNEIRFRHPPEAMLTLLAGGEA